MEYTKEQKTALGSLIQEYDNRYSTVENVLSYIYASDEEKLVLLKSYATEQSDKLTTQISEVDNSKTALQALKSSMDTVVNA